MIYFARYTNKCYSNKLKLVTDIKLCHLILNTKRTVKIILVIKPRYKISINQH